jgi:hypothetical protein
MNNEKPEEPKVSDPTNDLDLRLTKTEWVIYWKTKYGESLKKIVAAQNLLNNQQEQIKDLKKKLAEAKPAKAEKGSGRGKK